MNNKLFNYKRYFMINLIFFCSNLGLLFSQDFILYRSNFVPNIGDTIIEYYIEKKITNLNISGVDVNWNYSDFVFDKPYDTLYYLDPAITPYNDIFPSTNISCNVINGKNDYFSYFYYDSFSFVCLGTVSKYGIWIYNPFYEIMRFPIKYNDTFSFSWSYSDSALGIISQKRIGKVYADAIGNLKVSDLKYTKALRIKTIEQENKKYNDGKYSIGNFYTYTWFNELTKYPIMQVNIDTSRLFLKGDSTYHQLVKNLIRIVKYSKEHTLINNATPITENSLLVFPNPSYHNEINIEFISTKCANYKITVIPILSNKINCLSALVKLK